MMRVSKLVLAFFLFSACSSQGGPQSIALIVEVVDDQDRPFSGALVFIEERNYGTTDDRGRMTAQLNGPEGRRFGIRVSCPNGWIVENEKQRELNVRFLRPIDRKNAVPAPMDVLFRCVPVTRKIVLLVRADGQAGLPIKAMGRELAMTDGKGVAQSVIEGMPGDEIEIEIDTSDNPELRPSMPSRRFTMPMRNQILIFDQRFESKQSNSRKTRRRQRKHAGPKRI
jgi:hypothetical protein